MTSTHSILADKIASFGYGVYSIPYGFVTEGSGQLKSDRFAVADPLGSQDGFYLTCETIEDAFAEMEAADLLTRGAQ